MQQLGVGREGDGLGLHGGVHRDPLQVTCAERAGLVRDPQTLGQQKLQFVAEALPPMAEIRTLMRELVLEKLRAGEVLEIRIIDPTLAHPFVGQTVDVLEQKEPDDESGRDPGPASVAIERRDLAIDPVPVDLAGELHQLVLHVDDLVEPGAEQITFPCRLRLLRSHRPLRCNHGIMPGDSRES